MATLMWVVMDVVADITSGPGKKGPLLENFLVKKIKKSHNTCLFCIHLSTYYWPSTVIN